MIMRNKKFTLFFAGLMMVGLTTFGQLFQKIGDYQKIPESNYYLYNGQRCLPNNDLGILQPVDETLIGDIANCFGNTVVTRVVNRVSTSSNGTDTDGYGALIYTDAGVKHAYMAYSSSSNLFGSEYGFLGKSLFVDGTYYFQVRDISVDGVNISKGVCYYDGKDGQKNMTYILSSSGMYDEIGYGFLFKNLLMSVGTNLGYWDMSASGPAEPSIGSGVIFYDSLNYTGLTLNKILSQDNNQMILCYEDSAQYAVNSFTGEDTARLGGILYRTMKKQFSISKEYGDLQYVDTHIICTLKNDTVYGVQSDNVVKVMYAPTDLNGTAIKPKSVVGVVDSIVYFTSIGGASDVIYRWDGTTLKAMKHYGYAPHFKEFEGEAYFSFEISASYNYMVPSSLYKDKGDSIVPLYGFDQGYVDDINLVREGNHIYALDKYVSGIIGKLSMTQTTRCPGTTDTLAIETVDSAQIQWYKNGEIIDGATDSAYIFEYSMQDDNYYAVVSTTDKTQHTKTFTTYLNKTGMPEFLGAATIQNPCPGGQGIITINALKTNRGGIQCDSMIWYYNNEPIDIAANRDYALQGEELLISFVDTSKIGNYYVTLFGGQCAVAVTSDTLKLDTLGMPVLVKNEFVDAKGCDGVELQKQVIATESDGSAFNYNSGNCGLYLYFAHDSINFNSIAYPYSFDTQFDTLTYTIPAFSSDNTGLYYAQIKGRCGSLNTDTVSFTIGHPYTITNISGDISACAATDQQLKVSAATEGSIAFQWYLNDSIIEGASDSVYNIASLASSNAGAYSINVTGDCQDTTLNVANVEVLPATDIVEQPTDVSLKAGETLELAVAAEGAGDLSYQWKFNDNALDNQVSDTLKIENVTGDNDGQYSVEVNGLCGTVESNKATVTITLTAINEIKNITVNLYPNPTHNVINIKSDIVINSIHLCDISGKSIKTIKSNNDFVSINIADLAKGIYLLQVSTESGERTYRLEKE